MVRSGIEPRSPGSLANTMPTLCQRKYAVEMQKTVNSRNHSLFLFDSLIGPYQMIQFRARVDLGAMAMRRALTVGLSDSNFLQTVSSASTTINITVTFRLNRFFFVLQGPRIWLYSRFIIIIIIISSSCSSSWKAEFGDTHT